MVEGFIFKDIKLMKVKISIELDLSECSGYNINTVDDIKDGLQNLSFWLNELHLAQHRRLFDTLDIDGSPMQEEIKKAIKEDLNLSKQLFNDYYVEGITEDGHNFTFSHREPGYIERLFID